MVTIISSSNRIGNLTSLFSIKCAEVIEQKEGGVELFFLDQIPDDISLKSVYEHQSSWFADIGRKLIEPANKILFIVPEYNGSIPGILKLFIDAIDPKFFKGKKASLIGLAAGRAGNIRGMDHLTDVLHHLQVNVMPQKLPISGLNNLLEGDVVSDEATLKLIEQHIEKLLAF